MALDETNECSVPVRNLLDTGRQTKPSRETLTLNMFGGNRYKKQRCDCVKLLPKKPGNSETVEISALKYPVICSTMPSRVNDQDHPHLQDLEFAEDFDD